MELIYPIGFATFVLVGWLWVGVAYNIALKDKQVESLWGIPLGDFVEDGVGVMMSAMMIGVGGMVWPLLAVFGTIWLVARAMSGKVVRNLERRHVLEKALAESERQLAIARAEIDRAVPQPFEREAV